MSGDDFLRQITQVIDEMDPSQWQAPKRLPPMPVSHFAAWVAHMAATRGWSRAMCALRLGCGKNQITTWEREGAPPYIGLACAAIDAGLEAWEPGTGTERDDHV